MSSKSGPHEPGSQVVPWLLLAALACLPYVTTFGYGFVDYDDPHAIVHMPLIRLLTLANLPSYFEPRVYDGLPEYMPLKNLSYAVDYALFGLVPQAFRIQQQLWYVACVLLAFAWLRELLRRLLPPDAPTHRLAWIAAALFAVHPVHVESVAWLSGRKDVLSGAFVLGSLFAALRWRGSAARSGWLYASLGCSALALLAKPTAVVLPGLLLLQDVVGVPRRLWWKTLRPRLLLHAPSIVLCAGFAAFYLHVTAVHAQAWGGHGWRAFEGPSSMRWGQQILLMLEMSLWPAKLAVVHPPNVLSAVAWSGQVVAGVLGAMALLTALLVALARGSIWALPLGSFLIPIVPMVAAPPWQQYLAGRYLFHAVLGSALALTLVLYLLLHVRSQLARLAMFSAGVLVLSWGVSTFAYTHAFRNSLSLWEATVEVHPRFGWAYSMASNAALSTGNAERALALLDRCLTNVPDDARCQTQMGRLLLPMDPTRGEALLRAALPNDDDGEAHLALARRLADTQRAAEGSALYSQWLSGRPANSAQIGALARLQVEAGETQAALRTARYALEATALNSPAAPPPLALLVWIARGAGRSDLETRLNATAAQCDQAACFAQRMRW